MPGALPHLIAGCAMYLIGRYYFKRYFDGKEKIKERLLLALVCISFSFIPDFFLIIYYITYMMPKESFVVYHDLFSLILIPVSLGGLLLIRYVMNTRRKPIWTMGFLCILLHIVMDVFFEETSIWI